MAHRPLFFLTCVLSIGCESKDSATTDSTADTDTDTDTDTGTGTGTGTDTGRDTDTDVEFSPGQGTWLGTNFVIESDDCALGFAFGLSEDSRAWWDLEPTEDGWTLTSASGLVATCTQSSNDIECLASSVFDYTEGGSLGSVEIPPTDAIVTLDATSMGTLTSDSSSTVSTIWVGDCEGTECESLLSTIGVTAPCTTEVSSYDFNQEDFVPNEGTWSQNGFLWDEDGCDAATNLSFAGVPATSMEMVNNEDGTFTRTASSSDLAYNCTTDGLNFNCERALFMTLGPLTISIDAAGRFNNETFFTAHYSMVGECTEADCDATVEEWGVEFPCASTGTTSAVFAG